MGLKLTLSPVSAGGRQVGDLAVFALAAEVNLLIRYTNDSGTELVVDSPDNSQDVLLWLGGAGRGDAVWFMLNPSRIDSQGEITAPMPATIRLAPGQSIDRQVTLNRLNLDRWFDPGVFEAWVEFQGLRSNTVRFATEIRAESVPRLAQLALGGPDAWIRERAMVLLANVPGAPAAVLASGETAVHQAALERYAASLWRFMSDWDRLQKAAEVRAAFARLRAETWLPR